MLNVAAAPLSTTRIIEDADAGYGSKNRESDKKKFTRDRERLAGHGICIREVRAEGASETEESFWELDRERTYARLDELSTEELEEVLRASGAYSLNQLWVSNRSLSTLQAGLAAELSARCNGYRPQSSSPAAQNDPVLAKLWECYQDRSRVRIGYVNAQGAEREHELDIYGFFPLGGHEYLVGSNPKVSHPLTYRIDRIGSLKVLKETYEIPSSFNIAEYIFLPFDFSAARPVEAAFRFPAGISEYELDALTHERGALERAEDGESWLWRVEVRDLDAAASLALDNATLGMRPCSPPELVESWTSQIRKAVGAHGHAQE